MNNEFDSDFVYKECPCCEAQAFLKEEITEPKASPAWPDETIEFYSCSLCGYTRQQEVIDDPKRGVQVVEIYDLDAIPSLRRRTEYTGVKDPDKIPSDDWTYFIGEEEVREKDWQAEHEVRKQAMRGVLN